MPSLQNPGCVSRRIRSEPEPVTSSDPGVLAAVQGSWHRLKAAGAPREPRLESAMHRQPLVKAPPKAPGG